MRWWLSVAVPPPTVLGGLPVLERVDATCSDLHHGMATCAGHATVGVRTSRADGREQRKAPQPAALWSAVSVSPHPLTAGGLQALCVCPATMCCQREAGILRRNGLWQLQFFQRGLDLKNDGGNPDRTFVCSYVFASGWPISTDWPASIASVSISRPASSHSLTFAPSGARSVFTGSTAATGSLVCKLCAVARGARRKGKRDPFFGSLRNLVLARCTAVELSDATVSLNF